jgi:organic hydroperoxide reductase OsmC/OhrA
MQVHEYRANLSWSGSTGAGYKAYDRTHRVAVPPAQAELVLTSDPAFLGNPNLVNPEQLLTAAASSCQMLSFLALAARAGLDVVSYEDSAVATMPMDEARITTIVLNPVISVRVPADPAVVKGLVERAHEECYIARSLRTSVVVEAEVRVVVCHNNP